MGQNDEQNLYEVELKAYPFALVGFFITDENVENVFNEQIKPEDFEEIQNLIKEKLFKKDVEVEIVVAPYLVPPDEVNQTLDNLADVIFSQGED